MYSPNFCDSSILSWVPALLRNRRTVSNSYTTEELGNNRESCSESSEFQQLVGSGSKGLDAVISKLNKFCILFYILIWIDNGDFNQRVSL